MDNTKVDANHYLMEFICANCGHKFSKQIRKGTPAAGQAGICPNCGVRDNTSGVGGHKVIKANEDMIPHDGRQILMEGRPFR